jgi:hypothetical protein
MGAKSNWMSEGVTYQGVIPPNRFEKSASNVEIED